MDCTRRFIEILNVATWYGGIIQEDVALGYFFFLWEFHLK